MSARKTLKMMLEYLDTSGYDNNATLETLLEELVRREAGDIDSLERELEDNQETIRRLDVARQEARQESKLLIKQLLNDSLSRKLDHDWEYHQGAVICEKCNLFDINKKGDHSFAFDVDGKLQYIAYGVAPPCSGKKNLAWWDSEAEAETSG